MKTKLFLFIAVLVSCIATAQTFTDGGVSYSVTSPTTVAVGSNQCYSGPLALPSTVTDGVTSYQVTSIGDYTFFGCTALTSVTIPNSVTSIGNAAFSYCSVLTSVTIPNSVTSIGRGAFYSCTGLTAITIGNSVTSIGEVAFYKCSGLTSLTIPNSVTSIERYVFQSCSGLTSIIVPNSVTFIGDHAFVDCTGLTSITIGNSVTSIGDYAFAYCSALTSVTIPNSVTSIGDYAFYQSQLTSVTIPNSVTSIGSQSFRDTGLTSINIPSSVSSIGDYAFADNAGIMSVICNIPTPLPIDGTVFSGVNQGACSLTVPPSSVSAYQAAAQWQNFNPINALLCIVSIPDANFKNALLANTAINTNGDTEIQCSEAAAYTGGINIVNLGIANLTGIEAFTELTSLNCQQNGLSSLNVSANTHLTSLGCGWNHLTSLLLSSNTALRYLSCEYQSIASLDLSANIALISLYCPANAIPTLDLTHNIALTYLNCNGCHLTTLNIQNGNNSNITLFDTLNNTNLTCIQVDNSSYMNTHWANGKSVTANYSVDCSCTPTISVPTVVSSCNSTPSLGTPTTGGCTTVTITNNAPATFPVGNTTVVWTVRADNGHSATTNQVVTVSTITGQPQDTVLCPALNATTTISVVTNLVTPTYTWEYRVVTSAAPNPAWITISSGNAGAVYTNYTTGVLGIKRATTALPVVGTQYRVTVSAGSCSITSSTAKLTISSAATAGTITQSATVVCAGTTATFTISGYIATSIQWQSSATQYSTSVPPANWTDIAGANNASYTTNSITTSSNRYYRAIVTNNCLGLTATSAIKGINISASPNSGTITGGGAVCLNSPTNNKLTVTGFVGVIQWQYSTNNGNTWTNAPNGTAIAPNNIGVFTTISPSNSSAYNVRSFSNNTSFRVITTSGVCIQALPSNYVACTLTSPVATSISATNSTVCSNSSTSLTLASGYVGTIKWLKSTNNWVTSSTVLGTTPMVSTGNLMVATAFKAVLTVGGTCVAETAPITINIFTGPVGNSISSTTTSGSVLNPICASTNKVLNITGSYFGDIQWESAVVSLSSTTAPLTSDYSPIIGQIGSSYTVSNATAGKNYFRAKFTNAGCESTKVYSAAFIVYYNACRIMETIDATSSAKLSFDVVAFPNPYNENFILSLSTLSEENVGIMVYDMTGRLIEKREIKPIDVDGLQIGNNYPTGIYNVVVAQGTEVKTLRVIKR